MKPANRKAMFANRNVRKQQKKVFAVMAMDRKSNKNLNVNSHAPSTYKTFFDKKEAQDYAKYKRTLYKKVIVKTRNLSDLV